MAGIDRTTILHGPAHVTFGGSSFWSKGDVVLKPVNKRFNVDTAHAGKVDERLSDRIIEVTFEPAGQFTDTVAAVLWPYGGLDIGASLFGATDDALVVHGRDGIKITIHNAALTQMPNLRMGVDKTTLGPVKFTGLLAKNTDPGNAAAYFTIASAAYPGDTGFSVAEIFTASPVAAWGASPWDFFRTEAGWEISFDLQTSPTMVDGLGTVDMTLQGINVSAKAIPVGPSMAALMTALKTNQGLGTSLAGADLGISCGVVGAPDIFLTKAALVDADLGFGVTRKRIGPCEWVATRDGSSPLFSIAATP